VIRHSSVSPVVACAMGWYVLCRSFHHILAADTKRWTGLSVGRPAVLKVKRCGRG
jgi:hypothetical protein